MQIVRMFTGPDGVAHMEDIAFEELRLPAKELALRRFAVGSDSQWHVTKRRVVAIIQEGRCRIEMEDGTVREFGPGDIVPEEDMKGKGHRAFKIGRKPIVHSTVYLE